MDTAPKLDSSIESSNFAPLPSRERTHAPYPSGSGASALALPANLSTTESLLNPAPTPERGLDALPHAPVTHNPEIFACQNRKCTTKRERYGKKDPRFLFSAQWRDMKIGKRHVRVLDIVTHCPDCDTEHINTVIPVEWLDPAFSG